MTTRSRLSRADTLIDDPDALRRSLEGCDEHQRRRIVATLAMNLGKGGITAVHRATGVTRPTIYKGIKEIEDGTDIQSGRNRKHGGGRKSIEIMQPGIIAALKDILKSRTVGDPQSQSKWSSTSLRNLAKELAKRGFTIKHCTVGRLLKKMAIR